MQTCGFGCEQIIAYDKENYTVSCGKPSIGFEKSVHVAIDLCYNHNQKRGKKLRFTVFLCFNNHLHALSLHPEDMQTIILRTATKYMLPLLLLFSVFILLRGHYLPGGGFVGGLVASIAFVLHAFAFGKDKTRAFLRFHPGFFIPAGLSISIISGALPLLLGKAFMTGLWYPDAFPVIGMVGTALFFDIGVYVVVIGVTLTIIFTIAEAI